MVFPSSAVGVGAGRRGCRGAHANAPVVERVRAGAALARAGGVAVVIAPREAEDTSAAYFASAGECFLWVRGRRWRALLEIGVDVDRLRRDVDGDDVAVAEAADRAVHRGLGRDVPDHESVRGAAEASVRHQRDVASQALADERGAHREHLSHPRPPDRPLVADDDDVPRDNPSRLHRLERRFLGIEHAGRAGVPCAALTRELDDAPLGRERAAEDHDPAAGF